MTADTSSTTAVRVCRADALVNGGLGVKLPAQDRHGDASVFFVRYQDRVYGYLNRCAHLGVEIDWESSFFTRAGDLLMCARHGATYTPDTGLCVGGPCRNGTLKPLAVYESPDDAGDLMVYWTPSDGIVSKP